MLEAYYEELERRAIQCMEALLSAPPAPLPATTGAAAATKPGQSSKRRGRRRRRKPRLRGSGRGADVHDLRRPNDAGAPATAGDTCRGQAPGGVRHAACPDNAIAAALRCAELRPLSGTTPAVSSGVGVATTIGEGGRGCLPSADGGDTFLCARGRGVGHESPCAITTPPRGGTPTSPRCSTTPRASSPCSPSPAVSGVRLSHVASAAGARVVRPRTRSRSRSLVVSVSSADSALLTAESDGGCHTAPSAVAQLCTTGGGGRSSGAAWRPRAFARVLRHPPRTPAAPSAPMHAALQAKLEESYRVTSGMVGCAVARCDDGDLAVRDSSSGRANSTSRRCPPGSRHRYEACRTWHGCDCEDADTAGQWRSMEHWQGTVACRTQRLRADGARGLATLPGCPTPSMMYDWFQLA